MSDTMNTYFDRARNDVAATQEGTDTTTIDVEQTDADAADTPSTEITEETAHDDAESIDDTETDDADAEADDAEADAATDDDVADDEAEIIESADDSDDEADVIAEDDVPVTLIPVAVDLSDAPAESGDAPAAAETGAAEPAEVEPAAAVAAVAAIEARPSAGLRGATTVGDGIVSKVVNLVAAKADGVHRLDDEESLVTVDGDIVEIRVALVVEYGHAVKALAERLRVDVIEAVEGLLGLDVAAVDVHVSDIHFPDAI